MLTLSLEVDYMFTLASKFLLTGDNQDYALYTKQRLKVQQISMDRYFNNEIPTVDGF